MALRQIARSGLLSFLALALSGGCAPPFTMKVADARLVPERTVVLPLPATLFELDLSGNLTLKRDWSATATAHVNTATKSFADNHRMRIIAAGAHPWEEGLMQDFHEWSGTALSEIAAQALHKADYHRQSVDRWWFRRKLPQLRATLGADFALVVSFSDSHQSGGLTTAQVLGGATVQSMQTGVACLVNLNDGRVIWCEVTHSRIGDLRNAEGAGAAVNSLLSPWAPPS